MRTWARDDADEPVSPGVGDVSRVDSTTTPDAGPVRTASAKMWRPDEPVSSTTETVRERPTVTCTIGWVPFILTGTIVTPSPAPTAGGPVTTPNVTIAATATHTWIAAALRVRTGASQRARNLAPDCKDGVKRVRSDCEGKGWLPSSV